MRFWNKRSKVEEAVREQPPRWWMEWHCDMFGGDAEKGRRIVKRYEDFIAGSRKVYVELGLQDKISELRRASESLKKVLVKASGMKRFADIEETYFPANDGGYIYDAVGDLCGACKMLERALDHLDHGIDDLEWRLSKNREYLEAVLWKKAGKP